MMLMVLFQRQDNFQQQGFRIIELIKNSSYSFPNSHLFVSWSQKCLDFKTGFATNKCH